MQIRLRKPRIAPGAFLGGMQSAEAGQDRSKCGPSIAAENRNPLRTCMSREHLLVSAPTGNVAAYPHPAIPALATLEPRQSAFCCLLV